MQKVVSSTLITRSISFFCFRPAIHDEDSLTQRRDIGCPTHKMPKVGIFKILPLSRLICSTSQMGLTNEQIEEQLLQLADALAQVSEMTATAFEERDKDLEALKEKVAALEAKAGGE